jgi:tyrosinase
VNCNIEISILFYLAKLTDHVSIDSAIDRLFFTWQYLNPQTRLNVIGGTITYNNTPPSRPATLQDPLDLGPVGTAGVIEIQNAMSIVGGNGSPFCYIYA